MRFLIIFVTSLLYLVGNAQLVSHTAATSAKVKINDTTFVNITDYSADIIIDMKYADTFNFLNTKVYDCSVCFLRYKTVVQLLKVSSSLIKNGMKIKLFDCYRPLDIQKKMWALVPDANYVADPAKGSIHNRGAAVDMTLVKANGNDFDMGTPFDYFGKEASHSYTQLRKSVLKNRTFLKSIMLSNGFASFDSEWWHYNLMDGSSFTLANFKWNCN
jgi:D-alanyl-D-alanine dipeptidase